VGKRAAAGHGAGRQERIYDIRKELIKRYACQITIYACQITIYACQITIYPCQITIYPCQIIVYKIYIGVVLSPCLPLVSAHPSIAPSSTHTTARTLSSSDAPSTLSSSSSEAEPCDCRALRRCRASAILSRPYACMCTIRVRTLYH
jgi:hypothetical protein